MPAAITVIVPTLDDEQMLPGCAQALFEGLSEGILRQLIIADGGSTDATRRIADSIGADIVDAGPGLAERLTAGVAAARGDFLLLVDVTTRLAPGWAERVHMHLEEGTPAVVMRPGFVEKFARQAAITHGVFLRRSEFVRADDHGRVRLRQRPVVLIGR